MIVVITDSAYADLGEIARNIKADNPRRAATFVDELNDRCRNLGRMPRAFP